MKLIAASHLVVKKSSSPLAFTTTGGGAWKVWDRFISLNDKPVVHIGNICDTCEFFFRIMDAPASPCIDLAAIRSSLETGVSELQSVTDNFAALLPKGRYIAALFSITPRRAGTQAAPDYFSHEQRTLWPDAELEDNSPGPYYRGDSSQIKERQRLFEFCIPFQDPTSLDAERVAHYETLLSRGVRPTCVAISVLDVKAPSCLPVDDAGEDIEPDFHTHWCFANYLIDGHHKVEASHRQQQPITMLTFLAVDHSWKLTTEMMHHYGYDD